MGYGKKLKEILDERGISAYKIGKLTGIAPTTLYSIIENDRNIRYDYAVQLAGALGIEVSELCPAKPFLPIEKEQKACLSQLEKDKAMDTVLAEISCLFVRLLGISMSMSEVTELLFMFSQLDNDSKKEIIDEVREKYRNDLCQKAIERKNKLE